jgi:hypothetical protein
VKVARNAQCIRRKKPRNWRKLRVMKYGTDVGYYIDRDDASVDIPWIVI